MAELIAFDWLIQVLEYLIRNVGLEGVRAEIKARPQLKDLLTQVLGNDPAPAPPSPLTPFRVENNQIFLNGRLWKGLGMNFRELAFYGLGIEPIRWATDVHFFQQLDGAKANKASVIRVYCSHKAIPDVQQAIPRVRRVLDEAKKRGLYVILCLSDAAPDGEFFVSEAANFKAGRYTWEFIASYKTSNYWRYVDEMTKALGDHAAIFAWEPFNELTAPTWPLSADQANSMFALWRDTAALIRTNSPSKMIANGNVSGWELFVNEAYGGGKFALRMAKETAIDIHCFHSYPVTADIMGAAGEHLRNEIALIKGANIGRVAFILEETAARWDSQFLETSSEPLKKQADSVFPLGIASIIIWGVSFPYGSDIGVHGAGYPNWDRDPLAARWHNMIGWFNAIATELARAFS